MDEMIDRIPVALHQRTLRRNERPMSPPLRPLLYPPLQQLDLLCRQFPVRLRRRHDFRLIVARNALDQLAVGGLPRDDDGAIVAGAEGAFLRVEPEPSLPGLLVRSVAVV